MSRNTCKLIKFTCREIHDFIASDGTPGPAGTAPRERILTMQIDRCRNARGHDAYERWQHENDFLRPYGSLALTTQTSGTTFVRRVAPGKVAIVGRGGARLVEM